MITVTPISHPARWLALAAAALPLLSAASTEFGTVVVTQLNAGNDAAGTATASVSLALGSGTSAGVTLVGGNRGDFDMDFGPGIDPANGVLISSISELSRNNDAQGSTTGNFFATSSFGPDNGTTDFFIAIHRSPQGDEVNINPSFAYLPYNSWLGGIARNAVNNDALTTIVGSTGFTVGSGATDPGTFTVFDPTGTAGQYTVRLGSIIPPNTTLPATSTNGILLVSGAKNEDNYALSRANADGTFTIICHDNGANNGADENDGVGFAYLPAGAVGSNGLHAIGRVNGDASTDVAAGSFTVTKGATGIWYLQIPGHSPATGTLVVSPAGGVSNNGDNIVSHGWDVANSRWIIESRDLTDAAIVPALQNMANATEDAFSFAFFSLALVNPPPVVTLDSPANNGTVSLGTTVNLAATATDDGSVSKVQFYDGVTLLGEDTAAPFEFAWNGALLGRRSLTVRAIDNFFDATTSATTFLNVNPPAGTGGLFFDGGDDHVTFGDNPSLKLSTFTLECWFKREPGGAGAGTGAGGVTAIPLITKGRGENDASGLNCNYFMGIEVSSGKLAADFEDLNSGLNHPAIGTSVIPTGVWQHAAATFDGTAWRLYLNGNLETTVVTGGQMPENISTQHAGLGTAMNSTGARDGYFLGFMDEARIWNTARTLAEIQNSFNSQIPAATGLVARYAMNEASGIPLLSSAGPGVDGTLVNGVFRTTGAPFNLNVPPTIELASPADEAIDIPLTAPLSATVADLNGDNLTVTFHGRALGSVNDLEDFAVVALPDTQFYSENTGGNRAAIFSAQTDWVVAEKDTRNIGAVLHLGDITQNGDDPGTALNEWTNASNAMYRLENPTTTLLTDGLPYVLAVGNHDQTPIGNADGTTTNFNRYFGVHPSTQVNHFAGKSYYGGTSIPASADNNYILFSAGGIDFIVISLEYDTSQDVADLDWADALLKAHPARRGIVITHYMVGGGNPASFSTQGSAIYEALKDNPNLIFMHGGHIHDEGRRQDTFEGRVIHSILADYQGRANGGDGWLRILNFKPALNRIDIQTYSPTLDQFETDANSQFSIDVNLSGGLSAFTQIGSVTTAPGTATFNWTGLESGGRYEWYATVSDGSTTVTTPVRTFTAQGALYPPAITLTGPANGAFATAPGSFTLTADATDTDGTIAKVGFFSGTTLLHEDTTVPYSFDWQNIPVGSYTLIAKATDEEGLLTAAVPVSVTVLPPPVEAAAPVVTNVSTGLFNPPTWTVTATSPAPLGFTLPGSNLGDIELKIAGTPAPFLGGITLVANWNNPGNGGIASEDNISSAYADASGNTFINVVDNSNNNAAGSNPPAAEETAGTAAAYLRFADGFTGGIVAANGTVLAGNLPAGATVTKTGSGLYAVTGLSLAGNLLAFPNGNSGTEIDNVVSVRIAGGVWVIDTRDNASTDQDNPFSFVYLPPTTPGIFSGRIATNGSLAALNGSLGSLGATVVQNAAFTGITFGDGTVVNPSNTALFLIGDSTASFAAADNLVSYSASGNTFRIFTQDLPELTGSHQNIDIRFVAIPLDLQVAPEPQVVTIAATDATAGEHGPDQALAFTVTRTGPLAAPLVVSYNVSGVTPGSDIAALTGSVEIPANGTSVVIPVTVLADGLAEGDETLALTLTDAAAYDLGAIITASATIADRPLQAFLHANNLGGPDDDNDGDQVDNILEYYMGTLGHLAASQATLTAVAAGNGTFTASFPRAKSATDVTATIQWSTNLTNWFTTGQSNGVQTAEIVTQVVSPPAADPENLRAVLSITAGSVPSTIYLRLSVTP